MGAIMSRALFWALLQSLATLSIASSTPGKCVPIITAAMYKTEGAEWCEQACITPVLAPGVMQFGDVHFGRCDAHGYPHYDHTQDMKLFKVDLYRKDANRSSSLAV